VLPHGAYPGPGSRRRNPLRSPKRRRSLASPASCLDVGGAAGSSRLSCPSRISGTVALLRLGIDAAVDRSGGLSVALELDPADTPPHGATSSRARNPDRRRGASLDPVDCLHTRLHNHASHLLRHCRHPRAGRSPLPVVAALNGWLFLPLGYT